MIMRHHPSTDTPRSRRPWWAQVGTPADGPAGGIGRYHDLKALSFWLPDRTRYTRALGCCAAMVCYGLMLRSAMIPPPALGAACLTAVIAAPALCSAIRRVADRPGHDDGWARQEQAHWQALPAQLRCSRTLDRIEDYLATAPLGQWRSVHLAVPLTVPGQPGVCLYPHGNRLLIVVHRDLLEEGMDPARAVTWIARTLAMMRGWRYQLRLATSPPARMGGLLIAGWAVPWPWLLASLAAFQADMIVCGWLIELTADRYVLIHHGLAEALRHLPTPPSRAPRPYSCVHSRAVRWRGWALAAIAASAGYLPPPNRLRRALLIASQPPDAAHGHT